MKVKYKLIVFVPFMALTMEACRTYTNTVVDVFDNKKILVENAEGEERLIDCSKKNKQTEQLLKDIPYFHFGDQIKFKQAKIGRDNYDGRRVFTTEDYKVIYPRDTIQIRKDQEIIAKEKRSHNR